MEERDAVQKYIISQAFEFLDDFLGEDFTEKFDQGDFDRIIQAYMDLGKFVARETIRLKRKSFKRVK